MIFTALALAVAQPAVPPPTVNLTEPFAGMQFLLGHCWQGRFDDGKFDTHCFEPVYSGRLIRDRHEVTGGYAGETIYNWNAAENRAEYTYWNVSGGVSRGTMRERGGVLDFGDEVYTSRDGRETRIATTWRRVGDNAYEARITSSADPTGSRVVRYTRLDQAPVRMEESTAADGSRTLVHEVVVPATPEQVYEAVTTPAGWRSWAVRDAWASASDPDVLETTYIPNANPGDPRNIRQRYVLRVPNRLVAFRTVQAPTGFPHAEDFYRVTHIIELEPVDSGTRVRLTSAGYPAGAAGDTLVGFFRDGNRTSLVLLRRRFVDGPIDWTRSQQTAGH